MFIPFITAPNPKRLYRRKGGGGGGKGGGGGGSSTGKSSGSSSTGGSTSGGSSSSSSPKTKTVPLTSSTASGKSSAVAYGSGGGKPITIPTGQIFAGRSAGGGLRNQIYGTSTYGSGYPGIAGRGVLGRGFPFWFWPVVWGGVPVGSYLYASEYGNSYNTTRVGGPMAEATFISNSTNTTFHVLSDNSTISSLISSIDANCSSSLSSSSSTSPQPYNASVSGAPQPEQAIQYYRASSIVLTLDGYNNSATLNSNPNVTDSSLPSGIDTTLLNCLNQTIALSAPLISGAGPQWSVGPSNASLFGLLCFIWWALFVL